ncbi:MAG: glycosyltransferase [Chitinophagaceae bacterium]|nr:glycosyltransferase [Chitinophagaceae bacterium]
MPVYNAERFLNESIDCILNQTFPHFEFLIIDDKSTDTSVQIVEGYNDSRIRLVKNEKNIGVAATLNKGIQLATCELIARMDADDYSYPQRLEKQYNHFQKHPDCVLLYTFSRKITMDRTKSVDKVFNPEHVYFNLLFHCPIRHPSVMYKRSVIMEAGMYHNTYVEDFNLWFRISRKYKLDHLNEILFEYRVTDSSTSRVLRKKESEDAHFDQVRSHVQFYTGPDFKLNDNEIEFLRGLKAESVIKENVRSFFINCFKKLDYITTCVQQKKPSFVSAQSIVDAANEKKHKLLLNLMKYGKGQDVIPILLELGYYKLLMKVLSKKVLKKSHFYNSN